MSKLKSWVQLVRLVFADVSKPLPKYLEHVYNILDIDSGVAYLIALESNGQYKTILFN